MGNDSNKRYTKVSKLSLQVVCVCVYKKAFQLAFNRPVFAPSESDNLSGGISRGTSGILRQWRALRNDYDDATLREDNVHTRFVSYKLGSGWRGNRKKRL